MFAVSWRAGAGVSTFKVQPDVCNTGSLSALSLCKTEFKHFFFFFYLRLAPCFSVYFVLTNGCLIPLVAKIIRAMIILILQPTCELFSQLINLLTAQ